MDKQKSAKGVITAIVIAVLLLVIAALTAIILFLLKESTPKESEDTDNTGTAVVSQETEGAADDFDPEELIEAAGEAKVRPPEWYGSFASSGDVLRTIDLKPFKDRCPDVYAWIEIPGTDIDYPVAYCEDAVDPFYFTHDIDGNPSDKGMIITDSLNSRDFSDPETLIYGHDPEDGTMFSELHEFRNADFFRDHDRIYIYMDDAQLVYKIYACFIGSSDHILANNDFNDPIQFMRFFDSVGEIRDLSMNVRESAKPLLGDHAIALVTHCGDDSKRLFVHAVLEEVRY